MRVFLLAPLILLGIYGLLLAPAHNQSLPLVALCLHGAFYAATDGVIAAATAGTVPPELRATGLALVNTGQAAARFVCSFAFGAAWTAWGYHAALAAAACGISMSALLSVALLRRDKLTPNTMESVT
ncbi:hypothetical protein ABT272_43575 [Streptomyces sp900105245]|uniref:MFS transporter n=1 Tax=Streptomyces sp. 900105245 TaxID=3154379 RepID=A0ABV1UL39_9ACTN